MRISLSITNDHFNNLKRYTWFVGSHVIAVVMTLYNRSNKNYNSKEFWSDQGFANFKEHMLQTVGNIEYIITSFWAINTIAIIFITSFFMIETDKAQISKYRLKLKRFTLNFNLIIYCIITLYMFLCFFIFNQSPFFVYSLFTFESFYNTKFLFLYALTLFYPYIVFFGFENKKLFIPLRDKKFFMFYLLIYTFYIGFSYALFSTTFTNLIIPIELQSFVFAVLVSFLRNRVHYGLLISYILQVITCSAFILLGTAIFYYVFHTLEFSVIEILVKSGTLNNTETAYVYIGVFTFIFGIAGKAGAFPFFRWAFDLYPSLPLPLVFISSTVNKVGVLIPTLFILKICFENYLDIINPLIVSLFAFSAVGVTFTSIFGLTVKNLRELIAASSVIQTSYIFFLIFNPVYFGSVIIGLYLIGYIFALLAFFIFLLAIESQSVEDAEDKNMIEDNRSKTGNRIIITFFIGVVIWSVFLTISGFPPFTFFFSKFAFLANIYIAKFSFSLEFSIIIFIIFLTMNFFNMIIYTKFIFKNLNNKIQFYNLKKVFSKHMLYTYFFTLIFVTALLYLFLIRFF